MGDDRNRLASGADDAPALRRVRHTLLFGPAAPLQEGNVSLPELLERCRSARLVEAYEVHRGLVHIVQDGARIVLNLRQARTFLTASLRCMRWSYMDI